MKRWLTGVCGYDGKTYHVERTCEVVVSDMHRPTDEWEYCGRPTTHFYPTQMATQSLCSSHAKQHLPHGAWPATEGTTELSVLHRSSGDTR